ncbi:hypothetical protein B0G62_10438 [Paraburkholderia eburnea]|uniref:Uncharacterized protein n=1 Tax=Paraburkholderia eburnea TaxID=1189126 RepID=A0A2S4MDL2_9BURK|nr:hypothetical protein [Paraburkholderia eburnea]POR52741.1 hypothetical protein B0G62_10438 [Paraburkholderia eburnea]PRZ23609.1 hypothetical protein BX588_10438 [Paraburkholderia eburnea]
MNSLKLELVEDWHEFWKWSEVRWQAFLAVVVMAVGHLQDLLNHLPDLLMWVQANWPDLLPILQHFFPSATQADWITAANVITILLRVTQRKAPAQ